MNLPNTNGLEDHSLLNADVSQIDKSLTDHDMINLDKEEEKKSEGSDKDSFNVDESDEEDSSVIPDEKQPGDAD